MSDSVQLSDQFVVASALKSDPSGLVSKNKQVVYVSDTNQGSYQSGEVLLDITNQLTGSKGFASLREAYLTVPYVITARNTGANVMTRMSRFACTLKTGVWNVISDLQVELNGKAILTSNEYKSFWNNLRAQTETSISDLDKHASETFLYPDSWASINFSDVAAGPGDGYANNQINVLEKQEDTLPQSQEHWAFNKGLFDKLVNNTPMIVDTTTNKTFGWASMGKDACVQISQQMARGAFVENPGADAGVNAGIWIHMLKIRLADLHPLFKELDCIANPQLKIRYRVNCGTVEIAGNATTMSLVSSTLTSGTVCPIMVASAAENCAMNGILSNTAGSKVSFSFGVLRNAFTETANIGQFLPYTTTRLHIPFYDLIDARQIVSKPVKTIRYLDCYAQYFKDLAGKAVQDQQHNAAFNFQLSATLKNVKYVALIPFAETSLGHWATAHGTQQFASPFDSAPWTALPGACIRNFQVQLGNQNVFAKSHEYDYESFCDEFAKLSAMNGDADRAMNTGLINLNQWSFANRIMIADCSRISNRDVPTSIQVSGINACSQGMNILVLVAYERELEIDRLTGEVNSFTS
jgi:hypothetical protein